MDNQISIVGLKVPTGQSPLWLGNVEVRSVVVELEIGLDRKDAVKVFCDVGKCG